MLPSSINDENHSARIIQNKQGAHSVSKLNMEGKDIHQGTQHTHTDCDIQFTSFEIQPQIVPKGSFVGVNNLSDSTYKIVLKESQNIQQNQNIMNSNGHQLNNLSLIQSQSAQNMPTTKYGWGNSSYSKKLIKENYLFSKSDKKKENIALYINSISKKGSMYGHNVQEFHLDKVEQDIEEKQIAFSGIGIIKTFHINDNSNNNKNINANNNIINKSSNNKKINQNNSNTPNGITMNGNGKDPKSLASYHQKRIESIFDNMINRTSEKSVDFYDEHAQNFLYLNTQENKESVIYQGNVQTHQNIQFGRNNSSEYNAFSLVPANSQNKSAKPALTITGMDEPSILGKMPSTQPNKIHINILSLSEKDKQLLIKYAKNWLYLSRSFQQNGEWNESLSCLLPATSLFSQIGLADHLIMVLAEAYTSYLMIILTKKEEYSEINLKKIEQKFLYIRQTILSGSQNVTAQILEKQYTGSFINKAPNPLIQQEPSQKNTEKTFIFEDWRNAHPNSMHSSNKERCCNELVFFLELIYNAIKSPKKQFINVLSSLIDLVENDQTSSLLFNHPRLSSLYRDIKLIHNKVEQNEDKMVNFENKGMKTIIECIEQQSKGEQNENTQVKLMSMCRYLQTLLNDQSKILLNQYVEEANKTSEIKVNLKCKPMSHVLIKLGHLLRVWLDLSQHALFFYEQAFKHDKSSWEALFFIAITLRNLDKTQEAIQYYNQALEINNYYTECYINLGNIYLQEFQNLSIAENFYVKALISSYYTTIESNLVCKGRIFNLLGEIQKQNNEWILAAVFYSCGILKDSLYEENYYDLIDILSCVEFDGNEQTEYFKIIIELVSFSVFEKGDWKGILQKYKVQLKSIYVKSNIYINNTYFTLIEQIVESEDCYSKFHQTFHTNSIEQNELFLSLLLKKTILHNIKEINELYTRKSIQEESSKEDVQYIVILRDFLTEITDSPLHQE